MEAYMCIQRGIDLTEFRTWSIADHIYQKRMFNNSIWYNYTIRVYSLAKAGVQWWKLLLQKILFIHAPLKEYKNLSESMSDN